MYEQYVSALADLFFPQRCVGCDRRASDLLCRECFEALPTRRRVSCPPCARCETPTAFETLVCDACKGLDFGFESVRTPLRYEGVGDEIVHALKYCDYAKVIESQEAGCTADARGAQPRRVLRRRRARAAAPLAARAPRVQPGGAPRAGRRGGAGRTSFRYTRSGAQDSGSGRAHGSRERRANVEGAYAIRGRVRGRVLLVEDVFTTGAALSSCTETLLRGGAQEVHAVSLCRAAK